MWMRYVVIVIVIAIAALSFGAGRIYEGINKKFEWELAKALPDWMALGCAPPTTEEREIFALAATTLEISSRNRDVLGLGIGAQKFLSFGMYRKEGSKAVMVCPPEEVYRRAADILAAHGFHGRLVEYNLKLTAKLPARSASVVSAVANSAFSDSPQESEGFRGQDIRPYARTVLASFAQQSAEFATRAYSNMSATDSLGTGAAQVAAAAGHPEALPRIQAFMQDILSSIPKDKVVPLKTGDRLYELAYAVYFSGEEGKKYTAPIRELMTRKVQSPAPPFGLLELPPKRMCEVLIRIEGNPSAVNDYDYCTDIKALFTP